MFFCFISVIGSHISQNKSIKVTTYATWEASDYFSESINFFNQFYQDGYRCLIENIRGLRAIPKTLNETLDFHSNCLDDFHLKFLRYLLRFHYFSPRIEFYKNILNEKEDVKYEFEPDFNCHQNIDFNLLEKLNVKENCVIRPITKNKGKQIIGGYGMKLKPFKYSMEYGVRNNNENMFKPDFTMEMDNTREFLENITDINDMQPSPELLRKSFLSFVDEMKSNKIKTLKDITHNWPITASYVAKTKINQDVEDDFNSFQTGIQQGLNSMVMNGRDIPISTFDPFTFANSMDEEITIQKTLEKEFDLSKPSIKFLTKMEIPKQNFVYDIIKDDKVIWLNNIEKDKRYKKWKRNLSSLFGSLNTIPKIRKNIINIVLIIDPSVKKDFDILLDVYKLICKGYAARFGLILSPNLDDAKSIKINRKLSEIKQLLPILSKLSMYNSSSIEERFKNAYEEITNQKWDDFSDSSANFVQKQSQWIKYTGIYKSSLWINGELYKEYESIDMIKFYAFESIKKLRETIDVHYSGDILDFIFSHNKVVSKKISKIQELPPITINVIKLNQEKQRKLCNLIKTMKYTQEDSEFPYVSLWVYIRRNHKIIQNNINSYFNKEHNIPIRISYIDNIDYIEPNMLLPKDYDALLIVNGRIFPINYDFYDFDILFDWVSSSSITSHFVSSRELSFNKHINERERKDLCLFWHMTILSFDANNIKRKHFHPNTFYPDNPAVIISENEDSPINIECVLDPFTDSFQKIIGFLAEIEEMNIADISILLNLPEKLTYIPSSFYRYSIDNSIVFSYLNQSVIYSLIPDIPETWMIEQSQADVDLDNIYGKELDNGTYKANYILSNIILEGIAIDDNNMNCNGAYLVLSKQSINLTDTLVISEHGYWQLKANPGLFKVHAFNNYEINSKSSIQVVDSFNWKQNTIRLIKTNNSLNNVQDDGKIHIFAVTSGHLYERLSKIMMISAIKNANTTIKFWFFKNFLSPQFKNTLPLISKLYNIEYELVSYKWPHWLRRQTEKQRIAWGNKILFLDVLFPLSLKRVIYVDSDQIIRTNMRELMTMDFKGAPYAFTPFCNSRNETEPFRFWKKGYWHEHLKGKPYHISALFAIDLKRFRETNSGDLLRYYYELLSNDINSLANLDQDLPNYAQEKIPIYSLPQNWLWCETWCSDDTMNKAKTIDLCNNPLTKRPKLEIAKTKIPEWQKLDQEALSIETKYSYSDEL